MKRSLLVAPSLLFLISACASAVPPELVDARAAYTRAAHGPAAQLVPADLHVASEQLQIAERSFDDHGDAPETKDLAYTALRKTELAEVRARTAAALREQQLAKTQLDTLKDQQANATTAELATTRQELAGEEQRRIAAERTAQRAAADLARIASVKQEARGMVITLSGGVLFASAQSELLPAAQAKLSEVANALTQQDPDSRLRVEGFTDSQGSASFNQDLSQKRAEAVRAYLVAHGIAPDRVTAEGFGPARPVADNATAEGRADNRRVEIVVEPKRPTSP